MGPRRSSGKSLIEHMKADNVTKKKPKATSGKLRDVEVGQSGSGKKEKTPLEVIVDDSPDGSPVKSHVVPPKREKKQKRARQDSGESTYEKYAPPWNLSAEDRVTNIEGSMDFFHHCFLPKDKKAADKAPDIQLISTYYQQKYNVLLTETALVERFNTLRLNHSVLESEKDTLRLLTDKLVGEKEVLEEKVRALEKRVASDEQKMSELEEAKNRWEAEVNRLRERSETPKGC